MSEQSESRFSGVMDHIAVNSEDLKRDVDEYRKMGFRLETLYDDWAMMRDSKGFGIALLHGSKHPPHLGLRVDTREELEAAAASEGRSIKEHRDRSVSFYTKGVSGHAVEVIYYPPDYGEGKSS
jgi:4-hydroxyphenylpyruvate dioxygenase-like putative hemolysin